MEIFFEQTESYRNLVKKWGLDKSEFNNHFDDLLDLFKI